MRQMKKHMLFWKMPKTTADETMRNFHKFGKANISAAEMEKERERLRKKMAKTRSGDDTRTSETEPKQYKPSDFKLGESVKVHEHESYTVRFVSLPDAKGNLDVQMGILRSKVNISDLEIIDEKPNYAPKDSEAYRQRQDQDEQITYRCY